MKKVFALMLALICAVGSLTGCNEKEVSINDIDADGKYILPENNLDLTIWATQGTDYTPVTPIDGSVVVKWLNEKTNVTIKSMYGNGGGQWDPKLSKLIAGDNLPEIVYCSAGQGPAHFKRLKELGKLQVLTEEMIKTYAPNVWERVPEHLWEKMSDGEGNILGIPFKISLQEDQPFSTYAEDEKDYVEYIRKTQVVAPSDVLFNSTQTFWIRDDILTDIYPDAKTSEECEAIAKKEQGPIGDELLDIPIVSTEEYIDFMYKIKEKNYKTENGKTVYAFGYTGGDNWPALTWLGADMYGYKGHNYAGTWNNKEKKYEVLLDSDIVKEAAKTQNKMVNDKVIDPESLAHTINLYKEKVLNGQYAIIMPTYVSDGEKINNELASMGASFRFRPFITQVPNKEEYPVFTTSGAWTDAFGFTNILTEAELHQVLNWINVQFSDEYEQVKYWGPEDAGLYEETADGKRMFKDDKLNKYFIDGDKSVIENDKDTYGLGKAGGYIDVIAIDASKWNPTTMHRTNIWRPSNTGAYRFSYESEHAKNVIQYPSTNVWAAEYSDIPEVVTFWSNREQWESLIKKTFAVSAEEFDAKWDEAIADLNEIVDIKALEKAATEVCKKQWETIQ